MTKVTLTIQGMSCQHCVMQVQKTLSNAVGVTEQQVSIGTADVEFDEQITDPAALAQAVTDAGYEATVVPAAV